MKLEVVDLEIAHLKKLMGSLPNDFPMAPEELEKSYFSQGSVARCVLGDGEPVLAGGIVNLQWSRGEAWILPNAFFHRHLKSCLRIFKKNLPEMAAQNRFRRVQAVCGIGAPAKLFRYLDFDYEGSLKSFGPFGETCSMYARIFE